MILVISKDRDFSASVAEQVERELKLPCRQAESADKSLFFEARAVVTDDTLDAPVPVIALEGKLPLRMRDLLARIEMALASPVEIALGDYMLSPRNKRLVHKPSGKPADLTDKEAELLQALSRAGKKGMNREALMKEIWSVETPLDTHTLETHIYRLRGKIRDISGSDAIVEATQGGYRLAI